jgi:uncharacterized protein (DUF1778 family)
LYATTTYICLHKEHPTLSHTDAANAIDERSTERMSFRTKPRIKDAIQNGGGAFGVDDSVVTMNATYRAAMETIATHEHTILDPVDHEAFFAALDHAPAPTEKLRAAFARHKATIASK